MSIPQHSRILIKGDTNNSLPTVPTTFDHTQSPYWLSTDIYEREFYLNMKDERLFIRTSGSNIREIMLGSSGTTTGLTSFYYDDIDYNTLKNTYTSLPAGFYRITDFKTIHRILYTLENHSGTTEPLIVFVSNGVIHEDAYSELYPQDTIKYSITTPTDPAFTPVSASTKGWIYYRKDNERNISCGYDFRNVVFRRWSIDWEIYSSATTYAIFDTVLDGTDAYVSLVDSNTAAFTDELSWMPILISNTDKYLLWYSTTTNIASSINFVATSAYTDFYTFYNTALTSNVEIGLNLNDGLNYYSVLNNIVMGISPVCIIDNVRISSGERGTIYADNLLQDCDFDSYFTENIIGDAMSYVYASASFNGNLIDSSFSYNNIRDSFISNVVGASALSNFIGVNFANNFCGANFAYNTMGHTFSNNTIASNFSNNRIKDSFMNNFINTGFSNNEIGSGFQSNYIYKNFYNNNIVDSFQSNNIYEPFYNSNVDTNFNTNTVYTFGYNIIGKDCGSNTFGDGFQENIVGKDFQSNILGITNKYNVIGNGFIGNTTITGFTYNSVGDYASPSIDYTTATHVYADYHCEIFRSYDTFLSGITQRLKYHTYDSSTLEDRIIITNLTD